MGSQQGHEMVVGRYGRQQAILQYRACHSEVSGKAQRRMSRRQWEGRQAATGSRQEVRVCPCSQSILMPVPDHVAFRAARTNVLLPESLREPSATCVVMLSCKWRACVGFEVSLFRGAGNIAGVGMAAYIAF